MQFTPQGESLEQPEQVVSAPTRTVGRVSSVPRSDRGNPASRSSAAVTAATPVISSEPMVPPEEQIVERPSVFRFHKVAFLVTGAALALIVLAGAAALLFSSNSRDAGKADSPASYAISKAPEQGLTANEQLAVEPNSKLVLNGQLKVGDSLVLVPTNKPSAPTAGQIYYDKTTNAPYFYNGTQFVSLVPQTVASVTSLGGATGLIEVGNGLQVTNGQLTLSSTATQAFTGSKVSSLQGQTGNVTLAAGNGIGINGTTISNTGITGVHGNNGLSVAVAGGQVTLGLPQALGTADTPSFASLSLVSPLGIASGGTGSSTFNTGGVVYSDGTALVSTSAPGGDGLCLISTSGGPQFGSCSGGSAVTSLNDLAGGLQLQGGSGVTITDNGSDTITITATGATGANTSLSNLSGVAINTDLLPDSANARSLGSSTSSFKDLWLGGNATVDGTINGANISGGALSGGSVSGGSLTAGAVNDLNVSGSTISGGSGTGLTISAGGTDQDLTLQATGSGSVIVNAPTFHNANGATYSFAAGDASGTTATICTTQGNCGGVTGSGAAGTIAVFTGSGTTQTVGGSILSQSGTTLTVAGDLIQGTGGLTISAGGTDQNLSLQGTGTGSVIIQTPVFHNANGATYSFDSSDTGAVNTTICTTQGNCAGVGGGVTSPGGTADQLAKFINGQAIGDSIISDDGTTVTIGGSAAIQGSSGLSIGTSSVAGLLTLSDGASHITSLKAASLSGPNLTFVLPGSYGTSGQCIKTDGLGSLSFGDCLDSTTGVNSIVGASGGSAASGSVTLDNATTTSNSIIIDNASASAKGIASFNSSDFSVGSGAVSLSTVGITKGGTGANSAVSARTNLQAAELGANGDITSLTALTAITPSSALTIGATGQQLTLQGNASTVLTATSGAHTTTVGFAAPTANVTYTFAAAGAGSYDICTTQGNCVGTGGGVTTSGGTANQLVKFTGGQAIGNSTLSDDGTTFTIGDSSITGTGALSIAAGGTNQDLSLQGSGTGSVVIQTPTFHNAHGATYNFDSSDTSGINATICTTQGNCAGAGGGVTGSGAAGTIAVFTGSGTTQTIGGSILSQSGTTLTVAGSTVTGTGALNISAGGTNQNLSLQGTGTGVVAVTGNMTVSGTSTLQGTVNAATGLQTGATTRIDATGALQNVSFGSATGALVTGSTGAISLASGVTTGLCLISGGTGTAPSFQVCPSGGGVTTVGTIDSQTKSTNGAVISGSTIYLQSADASNPGLVTNTGTQTFGGNKIFTGSVAVQNTSGGTVLNVSPVTSTLSLLAPTLTYQGGIDGSGTTNGGTTGLAFNDVIVSGRYEYAATKAVSGLCPPSSPATKSNCELRVTDISNPAAPTYVGGASSCNTITTTCNQSMSSIAMSGHYIYAATDGGNGGCSSQINCELKVYDVANPAAPTYVGGADASGGTNTGSGYVNFNSVAISGRYAYVTSDGNATACSQAAGSAIGCELKIFDISNPAAPTYVGGADASGSTNSGTGSADLVSVTVSGRYAYVTSSGNTGTCSQAAGSAIGCELKIFDISNPAAPTYVAGVDSSGSTNSGSGTDQLNSVTVSGRYAYVTSAADATACSATAGSAQGCELKVFDVSNPTAPTYVAGVDASGATNTGTGSSAFTSTAVAGGYAYVTTGASSTACSGSVGSAIGCELQEYNVSNPANPTYVGGADASGSTNSGTIGIQFNSVAISGRYAYIATSSSFATCSATAGSATGCENKVFDVSGIDAPAVQAGSAEAGTLQVDNDGTVYGNFNVQGSLNVGQGAEINGDLGVQGSLNISQSASIGGNTNITGTVCIGSAACTGAEQLGVTGTGVASGGFSSGTPDVAEYIDTSSEVTAQDIVIADPNNAEAATTTSTPYDPAVIGIIADGTSGFQMLNAHYGQAFNAITDTPDASAKPMTVTGRVPVKVTGEGGAIKPGDYITTSSTAGYAMKADHAGPVVGKALGFFSGTSASDKGAVLVLVDPGDYSGPSTTDYLQNGGSATLSDLTISGMTDLADLNVSGRATIANLHVTGSATIDGSLTVQAITTAMLTVNGHIITGGKTPTVVADAAAGGGAVTIDGDDTSGTITITTGNGALNSGDVGTITFDQPYGKTPRIVMTGQDDNSVNARVFPSGKTPTDFKLGTGTPLQPNTTYTFDYFITQ